MKKSFIFCLLLLGAAVSLSAQNLQYNFDNSSGSNTVTISIADSSGNILPAVVLSPGNNFSGTLGGSIKFPLRYKILDSSGCSAVGSIVSSPSGIVPVTMTCGGVPASSPTAKYSVSPVGTNHDLRFKFL